MPSITSGKLYRYHEGKTLRFRLRISWPTDEILEHDSAEELDSDHFILEVRDEAAGGEWVQLGAYQSLSIAQNASQKKLGARSRPIRWGDEDDLMDDREATAFHEAGHALIAHRIDATSVEYVQIYQTEGRYEGDTRLFPERLDAMSEVNAAAVALAGMLSEANASLRTKDAGSSIRVTDQLMAEIARVVGLVPMMGDDPIPAAIPTNSFIPGAQVIPAKLTVEDAEFLGEDVLLPAQLRQAATKALFHINEAVDWEAIVKTANELMAIEPERLTGYAAFLDGD